MRALPQGAPLFAPHQPPSQLPWWVMQQNPSQQTPMPSFGGGILGQQQPQGPLGQPGMGGLFSGPQGDGLIAAAASLLESGGRSTQKVGLGQALGRSMMAGRQATQQSSMNALQMKLLQKQLEQKPRSQPVTVVGPDGKPMLMDAQEAIEKGLQPFIDPKGAASQSSLMQEYTLAKEQGYKGTVLDYQKEIAQSRQAPAAESFSPIPLGDGTYGVLSNRSGNIRPTGQQAPPKAETKLTEGELSSGNYLGRMEASEKLLGNYEPAFKDYVAGMKMIEGGPTAGAMANMMLSKEGQGYYQAAQDWVRAKLRKESGAAIPTEEMAKEIKLYFPMPGDSKEVIAQKAAARRQAAEGMRGMSGRAAPKPDLPGGNEADPFGILDQ